MAAITASPAAGDNPLGLAAGTHWVPQRSVKMKYRGVAYSVVRGGPPNVWRWSVMVGKPEMLRMGDAETERRAEIEVRGVIDRALDVVEALRFLDSRQPAKND